MIGVAMEAHRHIGEALCPKRYTKERLQIMMKAVGSYAAAALYQQRPGPKGGIIFKRSKWKFWTVLPELEEIIGRCMRKEPGDRWQTMREVHGVLAGLRQNFDSGALVTPKLPPVPVWKPKEKRSPTVEAAARRQADF